MPGRPRDRRELSFWDHLDELRARIIRSAAYIVVAAVAGWIWRQPLLVLLRHPAEVGARAVGVEQLPFRVFEPLGGFMIAIQVALVAGLIAAAPLIIWEVWRFVEPALEEHERHYALLVLPFACLLFLGGVVFCYYVSPSAFAYLFRIDLTLGVQLERTLQPYLWFIMRLMLAFGLAFELPLVLMFLGFIGVVTSEQLLAWWRYAIVVIFLFAAIVTPTVDPVNMTILAAPMFALYMLSILLVRIVQRKRRLAAEEAEEHGPEEPEATPETTAASAAAPEDPYGPARAADAELASSAGFDAGASVPIPPEEPGDVSIPPPVSEPPEGSE